MLKLKDYVPIRYQVLNHLRNLILTNKITRGKRLYEETLASEIGSSRTPVREALHILEKEGLVEAIPRVGYVVRELNREEFDEIVEIRKAIETLAATWAAHKVSNSMLEKLRNNIRRSEELIGQGDVKKFVDMDAQFHELIAEISGKRRIYEMSQNLRSYMLSYRVSSIYSKEVAQRAVRGHKNIIKAIMKNNKAQIRKTILLHLNQVKKDVLAYSFKKPKVI
jgi:DNA-binding GntR family transcriptional regulator